LSSRPGPRVSRAGPQAGARGHRLEARRCAYTPGSRGLWLKVKCLYREEFVVVGWTDPEGRRPYLGALLLAYYDPDGRLVYAGRAGTGINTAELQRLWRRLQPLAIDKMPLDVPRGSRFGSPLVLSRVHWVRPELVAEVKYLTWTEDNLLRQVVYEGLREDKPAAEVRRSPPYPKHSLHGLLAAHLSQILCLPAPSNGAAAEVIRRTMEDSSEPAPSCFYCPSAASIYR
jgi:ATP dependent DNA ligase C terminal region